MKNLNFRKIKDSIRDKVFIKIDYAGGDADISIIHDYPLQIKYSEIQNNMSIIEAVVDLYSRLKETVSNPGALHYDRKIKRHYIQHYDQEKKYIDEDLEACLDDIPGDTTADNQFKCYIDYISLIAYDNDGNMYESYV